MLITEQERSKMFYCNKIIKNFKCGQIAKTVHRVFIKNIECINNMDQKLKQNFDEICVSQYTKSSCF